MEEDAPPAYESLIPQALIPQSIADKISSKPKK